MGTECSIELAKPVVDCQSCRACTTDDGVPFPDARPCGSSSRAFPEIGDAEQLAGLEEEEFCCSSSSRAPPQPGSSSRQGSDRRHPLLQLGAQLEDHGPGTPRGPTPPWAVALATARQTPVDKTSTGATPPRIAIPTRTAPPGLPEELEGPGASPPPPLLVALGINYSRDLFRAVRTARTQALAEMLGQAKEMSLKMVYSGNLRNAESDEAVATMLSHARDPGAGETFLGAATKNGHTAVVQALLMHRAEPSACDSRGRMALHRAAEGGSVLNLLMVLDRLQSTDKMVSAANFVDCHGDTPGMVAAASGSNEVCRSLEILGDLQLEAEQRWAGQHLEGPYGGLLHPLEPAGGAGGVGSSEEAALLREAALGTALVPRLGPELPCTEADLTGQLQLACEGLQEAEEILMQTCWTANQNGLSPELRSFTRTADLRAKWQKLRKEALASEDAATDLVDFTWQTHLTAEEMIAFAKKQHGSLHHLYLGVLWLFSRESWLPHIADALAGALRASGDAGGPPPGSDGTGATPQEHHGPKGPLWALAKALAPMTQLVQAAMLFFAQQGIRHESITYRPISMPVPGLRRLIDRYLVQREAEKRAEAADEAEESPAFAANGSVWFALGSGIFPAAFASRWDAGRKLARARCNVLLTISNDSKYPTFPEHMSVKGGSEDVLYPLGSLFRLVRLSRTTSCDLDPDKSSKGSDNEWPVTVVELTAADRRPEVLRVMNQRGMLQPGELEKNLAAWRSTAPMKRGEQKKPESGIEEEGEGLSVNVVTPKSGYGGGWV